MNWEVEGGTRHVGEKKINGIFITENVVEYENLEVS